MQHTPGQQADGGAVVDVAPRTAAPEPRASSVNDSELDEARRAPRQLQRAQPRRHVPRRALRSVSAAWPASEASNGVGASPTGPHHHLRWGREQLLIRIVGRDFTI